MMLYVSAHRIEEIKKQYNCGLNEAGKIARKEYLIEKAAEAQSIQELKNVLHTIIEVLL